MADGGVSKVGVFFTSHGPSGPDGLAVDGRDRLIVANPGLGRVWVLNEYGEPEVILKGAPGLLLTNVALGGDNGERLFVTDSTNGAVLYADIGMGA